MIQSLKDLHQAVRRGELNGKTIEVNLGGRRCIAEVKDNSMHYTHTIEPDGTKLPVRHVNDVTEEVVITGLDPKPVSRYDAGDLMTRMRPNVEAILQSLAIDNPPSQSSRCIRAIEVYKDITEFHYSSDDNIDREMGLAFKIKDMSSTRFLRFLNSQKKLGRIRREMRHDIKVLELFMALHEVCGVVEGGGLEAAMAPSKSVRMTCDLSRTWKYENCVMVDGEIFEVPEQG